MSNFRDSTAVEDALRRIAIATGRQPMRIQMPNQEEVYVPLSALVAYTKGAPAESLAADVDDLQERIQNDIRTGSAIYRHLTSGSACTHSEDGERALRHYLAFAALAHCRAFSGGARTSEKSLQLQARRALVAFSFRAAQ